MNRRCATPIQTRWQLNHVINMFKISHFQIKALLCYLNCNTTFLSGRPPPKPVISPSPVVFLHLAFLPANKSQWHKYRQSSALLHINTLCVGQQVNVSSTNNISTSPLLPNCNVFLLFKSFTTSMKSIFLIEICSVSEM